MTRATLTYRDGFKTEEVNLNWDEWKELWLTGKRGGRIVVALSVDDFQVQFGSPNDGPPAGKLA